MPYYLFSFGGVLCLPVDFSLLVVLGSMVAPLFCFFLHKVLAVAFTFAVGHLCCPKQFYPPNSFSFKITNCIQAQNKRLCWPVYQEILERI
jgi:hypothetical protein